jgi:hypothetical protein
VETTESRIRKLEEKVLDVMEHVVDESNQVLGRTTVGTAGTLPPLVIPIPNALASASIQVTETHGIQ